MPVDPKTTTKEQAETPAAAKAEQPQKKETPAVTAVQPGSARAVSPTPKAKPQPQQVETPGMQAGAPRLVPNHLVGEDRWPGQWPGEERFSRRISYYLRHAYPKEQQQLRFKPNGVANLDALLECLQSEFKRERLTLPMILNAVRRNEKGRFQLEETPFRTSIGHTIMRATGIRATQGHTRVRVVLDEAMTRLSGNELPETGYHTTNRTNVNGIVANGLIAGGPMKTGKMCHLSPYAPWDMCYQSGMVKTAPILVELDLKLAATLGCKFYKTGSDAIFCSETIPAQCIRRIIVTITALVLYDRNAIVDRTGGSVKEQAETPANQPQSSNKTPVKESLYKTEPEPDPKKIKTEQSEKFDYWRDTPEDFNPEGSSDEEKARII